MDSKPTSEPEKWRLIHHVHPETISLGCAAGLFRYDDGIYELTPLGDAWLRQFVEQKLAEMER